MSIRGQPRSQTNSTPIGYAHLQVNLDSQVLVLEKNIPCVPQKNKKCTKTVPYDSGGSPLQKLMKLAKGQPYSPTNEYLCAGIGPYSGPKSSHNTQKTWIMCVCVYVCMYGCAWYQQSVMVRTGDVVTSSIIENLDDGD